LSQNRTFYSPVWGLVCHPDSTLQNRTVRLKTGQVVSLVPHLRFFSISVKIFFGPPFEVFLDFSWGLNFVYQFISLSHEIQICEEIIWYRYTVIITWTPLFTIGKTQVLRKMGIQFFFWYFFSPFWKLTNRDAQCPGENLVCHRGSELQTGTIPVNPGRVVSLTTLLDISTHWSHNFKIFLSKTKNLLSRDRNDWPNFCYTSNFVFNANNPRT
jgi:hypothetical protein